ncbi:MAG TPA: alpha/beta-type small acid-soluble spore protein [Firmicutes bacterium]|nr:alpha/beta-type small acid-soluble spore protein [Bacillota bacterium]
MASNKNLVPEAREGLNRFKMEAANEVGVNLKQGYNGDLTSKQAGSIGGQMVKKIFPERTARFVRHNRRVLNHQTEILYTVGMAV